MTEDDQDLKLERIARLVMALQAHGMDEDRALRAVQIPRSGRPMTRRAERKNGGGNGLVASVN